jgi:hypothetical protein
MQVTYESIETLHEGIEARPSRLLTVGGNPKTDKGESYGYLTGILHLAPARLSGFNVCSSATAGCTAACLNTAGMQGSDGGHRRMIIGARIRRTKWFKADRQAFMLQLHKDIAALVRQAAREALLPAVRLNGTSDLPWENIRYERPDGSTGTVFDAFPNVQFYDYTKVATRFKRPLPANYDLTFSAADGNEAAVAVAVKHGARVAIVFGNVNRPRAKKWTLPAQYQGRTVVDADKHDLRFLEPAGVICGLRAKGLAKADTSGFVRFVSTDLDPTEILFPDDHEIF